MVPARQPESLTSTAPYHLQWPSLIEDMSHLRSLGNCIEMPQGNARQPDGLVHMQQTGNQRIWKQHNFDRLQMQSAQELGDRNFHRALATQDCHLSSQTFSQPTNRWSNLLEIDRMPSRAQGMCLPESNFQDLHRATAPLQASMKQAGQAAQALRGPGRMKHSSSKYVPGLVREREREREFL